MGLKRPHGGNHSWAGEILEFMPHEPRLLRPANSGKRRAGYSLAAKNGVKYAVEHGARR